MALRNQPYLPLYVNDFLTDEKLNQCSLSSVGVYIKLMCLLHKSEEYGVILLKQKDKQSVEQIKNFSRKIACSLPLQINDIENALNDLIEEEVLVIDGDKLYQKRMVRDNELSSKRALNGAKGGKKTQSKGNKKEKKGVEFAKAKNKATTKAKVKANSENEYIDENISENNVFINGFTSNISLQTCLIEFCKMRNEIKKPLTERALKMLLEKLKGMTSDEGEMCEILRESIMNSWQGIFPLKNNHQSQVATKPRELTLQEKIKSGYYDEPS